MPWDKYIRIFFKTCYFVICRISIFSARQHRSYFIMKLSYKVPLCKWCHHLSNPERSFDLSYIGHALNYTCLSHVIPIDVQRRRNEIQIAWYTIPQNQFIKSSHQKYTPETFLIIMAFQLLGCVSNLSTKNNEDIVGVAYCFEYDAVYFRRQVELRCSTLFEAVGVSRTVGAPRLTQRYELGQVILSFSSLCFPPPCLAKTFLITTCN